MAPKKGKTPVQEEEQPVAPPEPEEPEIPPEDAVAELETGLQLLLRPFDVKEIWSLSPDFAAQEKRIAQLLGLEEAIPVANQRSIVCEFHLFNLMHAKTLCLGALQGAAFHAILARILDMMKIANATPATKPQEGCGAAQCFKEFERLLLVHSVEDPPQRLAVFQATEARLLTDYAASTLFKHFLLYQFCVNFQQESETVRRTMSIQRPMAPVDLRQGLLRVDEAPVEEGDQQAPVEEPEPTEEEEVNRIVQEKLRETEERLQMKLDAREEMLAAKASRLQAGSHRPRPAPCRRAAHRPPRRAMKLPRTLVEQLKWAGPYRVALVSVFTVGTGKILWDSWQKIHKDFTSKLSLDTRRPRFDPERIPASRERRDG